MGLYLTRGDTRCARLYILQINLQDHSFNMPYWKPFPLVMLLLGPIPELDLR